MMHELDRVCNSLGDNGLVMSSNVRAHLNRPFLML